MSWLCPVILGYGRKGKIMRDYVILTDSGTDLSPAKAEEIGVRVLDLMVIMEGGEPTPNREVDPKSF